ncbi:MAG: undecaprenyl-phosphate galactose phosphotransferase WbaP [Actinomycetota bacterium]|nr:undecaprenyl-phosphate galactose phosphotransferase WbaP [Actinomycetota bacterium]
MEQRTNQKSEDAGGAREGETLSEPSFVTRARRLGPLWRQRLVISSLVFADLSLALLLWGVVYLLREFMRIPGEVSGVALAAVLSSVALWLGLRAALGLYPGYGLDAVEKLRRHTYSVFVALAILALFALGFQVGDLISRLLLGVSFLGLIFFAPVVRHGLSSMLRRIGLWGRPVIVLSYKDTGVKFVELMRQEWGLGYKPVVLFDYNLVPAGQAFSEVPYQETLSDAERFAREQSIDTIIFAMPYTRREQLAHMVRLASESFRYVLILPNLTGVTNSAVIARHLGGTFAVEIKHNLLDPWAQRLKRALDLFGAVVGGLFISPLILLLTALIRLDSPGGSFYGHHRLGAGGEHFFCWKFRTMHEDADRLLDDHLEENPELRTEWEENHKLRDDPRVTRVGRILRRTSLDELPQLWNVLKGEMSLAGPRPIVDDEVGKYEEVYDLYKRIKPGMSGLWQVSGRSETDYAQRVATDSYYVRNWSVWLDIVILARTVRIVARGRGAY